MYSDMELSIIVEFGSADFTFNGHNARVGLERFIIKRPGWNLVCDVDVTNDEEPAGPEDETEDVKEPEEPENEW